MYEKTNDDLEQPNRRTTSAMFLDADDVAALATLMFELREVTQSRRSFAAASTFLRRFGAENESPRLVPVDA
jgi:hypothetical protein